MVANTTDFSTERVSCEVLSPGRDSNPRPAAYKAAALPLSYPGARPQASRRTPANAYASLSARFSHRLPLVGTLGLEASLVSTLRTFGPRFRLRASGPNP